mgnify:CR=1 FL=1
MRIILIFLVFISCGDTGKILPPSKGQNSEVVFVVNDDLWFHSIDSLASITFGESIAGVNQIESLFKIIQINHGQFNSVLKKHRNIVIISEGSTTSRQRNKWAEGQFVAQLNWQHNTNKFLKELMELRLVFTKKELNSLRISFEKSSNKDIEKSVLNNFDVKLIIPQEYQNIINDSTFFWASHNPVNSDEIKNILVFSFIPKNTNLQQQILLKTDSMFKKHLDGRKEGTYVRIEPEYPPHYFEEVYRGLWKLENGFMGGPFIIKTYFVKQKVVVCVGMVFAPQNRKRKYIKEFEAIL